MNLLSVALINASKKTPRHSSGSKKTSNNHEEKADDLVIYSLDEVLKSSEDSNQNEELRYCIYNLIQSIPEMKAVVDSYVSKLESSRDSKVALLCGELESYCEPSAIIAEKYNNAISNLNSVGFTVEVLEDIVETEYGNLWYVKPNPFGSPLYCKAPQTLMLDGVILDKETFESGKNPFEIELDAYLKNYPNFKQEYESLLAEIDSLEKRKIALALSSSKKEELARLKQKFESVNTVYNNICKYHEKIEKYKNLSPESRESISHFFAVQDEFSALSNEVLKLKSKISQINGGENPKDVKDLIEQSRVEAIDSLTQEEKQILEKIPSSIALIILNLDDKTFTEYAINYYYFPGDGFNPKKEINLNLIDACEMETRKQYRQKAKPSSGDQLGE